MARIDEEHRVGIVETAITVGGVNSPDGILEYIWENWDDVINKAVIVRSGKVARLDALKRHRSDLDTRRPALDQEIRDLERDVGPTP